MRIPVLLTIVLGLFLPSLASAKFCTYGNGWTMEGCKCRYGRLESIAKGTWKVSRLFPKKTVLGKLRKQAKRFCKQTKGHIAAWYDKILSWKVTGQGANRKGTMRLKFTCVWKHRKQSKHSRGPWHRSYAGNISKRVTYAKSKFKNLSSFKKYAKYTACGASQIRQALLTQLRKKHGSSVSLQVKQIKDVKTHVNLQQVPCPGCKKFAWKLYCIRWVNYKYTYKKREKLSRCRRN